MSEVIGTRLFCSNYQMAICDDPHRPLSDEENWQDADFKRGFAGGIHLRLIGTEADLNDHWVELVLVDEPPDIQAWQRVTCVHFRCETGNLYLMSVVDNEAALSVDLPIGDYSIYVAGQNMGVDQLALGEETELSDAQLRARRDLEWYRLHVVPGAPKKVGRLRDAS